MCAHETYRDRKRQPAIRGESTIPYRKDLAGCVPVVAEIRENVYQPSPKDGGNDDPHEGNAEPLIGVSACAEAVSKMAIADPKRDREPDPIGVDRERSEVEEDGDGSH